MSSESTMQGVSGRLRARKAAIPGSSSGMASALTGGTGERDVRGSPVAPAQSGTHRRRGTGNPAKPLPDREIEGGPEPIAVCRRPRDGEPVMTALQRCVGHVVPGVVELSIGEDAGGTVRLTGGAGRERGHVQLMPGRVEKGRVKLVVPAVPRVEVDLDLARSGQMDGVDRREPGVGLNI